MKLPVKRMLVVSVVDFLYASGKPAAATADD
jgi:hypothetical protein